jgi:hypothetical protein
MLPICIFSKRFNPVFSIRNEDLIIYMSVLVPTFGRGNCKLFNPHSLKPLFQVINHLFDIPCLGTSGMFFLEVFDRSHGNFPMSAHEH